ncbi:MAG: phosphoglucomutase/phosphomannomutase family protein, partial [Dehalococcoidia bacterium]
MSDGATTITFGTDGWRALIARDYTFENVRACAEGVCLLLEESSKAAQGLVIGYDTRFGSPEFAAEVAQVSAAHGIRTYLADHAVPTPALSFSVLNHGAGGGVVITASHNSSLWNGFKYKPDYAGSASPEIIERLERHIAQARAREIRVKPLDQA